MGDDMIYTGGGHPQGVPLPFRQPHVGLSLFDAIALGRWARGEMALAHFLIRVASVGGDGCGFLATRRRR